MKDNTKKPIITDQDVNYVAGLSRLSLNEKDVEKLKGQLSTILEYIAQLAEVDTKDTAPTTHVLASMKNVFREDKLKESLSPEDALANAPSKEKSFFKVPRILG